MTRVPRLPFLLACSVLLGCGSSTERLAPLTGRWVASDKWHQGCAIVFDEDGTLLFEQADGQREVCLVSEVEVAPLSKWTSYRIVYEGRDGSDVRLDLEASGEVLRFAGQEDTLWRREAEAP